MISTWPVTAKKAEESRLRSRTPGPPPFSPVNSTSVKQRPQLLTKHEGQL